MDDNAWDIRCLENESFLEDYGPRDHWICHCNNPHNLDVLETNTFNITANILPMTLPEASTKILCHAQLYVYATCWCTLSKFFVIRCIINTLFWTVLILKNHNTIYTSFTKMALAFWHITLLTFRNHPESCIRTITGDRSIVTKWLHPYSKEITNYLPLW